MHAVEDYMHAQSALELTASSSSLILAGIVDVNSGPLGSGMSFRVENLAKNC